MLLVLILVLAVLAVVILISLLNQKLSEYQLLNGAVFKVFIFVFNQVNKTVEASLLTIVITYLIFLEQPRIEKKWDIFNFLFLLFVSLILIVQFWL